MNFVPIEKRTRAAPGAGAALCAVIAASILLLLLIRPIGYVDTFDYAKHVVDESHHLLKPQQNPFWEFGHVLGRPLGYVLWSPLRGVLRTLCQGDDILAAGSVLIGISIAAGFLGAIFLFLLLTRLTRNTTIAAIVSVAYLSTHALLFYTETGMAYVPGISCQIAALYYLQRFIDEGRFSAVRGALAGLFLGLSLVLWFPYVLSVPGILCYALLIPETVPGGALTCDFRQRMPGLAGMAAGTIMPLLLVYLPVMIFCGFTHASAIAQWIARSRYDKRPINGLLRMAGSIPRAFLALNQGNTEWKRILFEHRRFTAGVLIKTGVWKLLLVYGMFALLVAQLWRSMWGRRLLLCLAAAAIPVVIFAAFLFEAGPPERYMALFPLLFLGFAWIMADRQASALVRLALAAFFASMLLTNMPALFRFRSEAGFESARARLAALNPILTSNDRILIFSLQDTVMGFVQAHPFDLLSRDRYLMIPAVPWGTIHVRQWRQQVAERTLSVWQRNGNIWISQRLLYERPDPAWGWVAGDDPRVSWEEVPAFFHSLDLVSPRGGDDGFSEIARTAKNEAHLTALALPESPSTLSSFHVLQKSEAR
ncbi:MAG TPA: hypothetical protein VH477_18885 [Bryobacteraceae bacterium]